MLKSLFSVSLMAALMGLFSLLWGELVQASGAVRDPPKPPNCRKIVAERGTAVGLWRGQFAGTFEKGMFRDYIRMYNGAGCFNSKAECERWIYDVRSHTIFLEERIVKCELYNG